MCVVCVCVVCLFIQIRGKVSYLWKLSDLFPFLLRELWAMWSERDFSPLNSPSQWSLNDSRRFIFRLIFMNKSLNRFSLQQHCLKNVNNENTWVWNPRDSLYSLMKHMAPDHRKWGSDVYSEPGVRRESMQQPPDPKLPCCSSPFCNVTLSSSKSRFIICTLSVRSDPSRISLYPQVTRVEIILAILNRDGIY